MRDALSHSLPPALHGGRKSPPNVLLGQFEHTQTLLLAQTPFFKIHGFAIGVAGAG